MRVQNKLSLLGVLIVSIMFPLSVSFASMPDKPCAPLSEDEQQRFYELVGKGVELAQSSADEAAVTLKEAMSICNDDYYTEYSLARVYQQMGLCHLAYFHFERLNSRYDSIDDREIKKALRKHFGTVSDECSNVVDLTVECVSAGTKLTISGFSNQEESCPLYSKIAPGAYPVLAKKPGFFDYKTTLNVVDGGVSLLKIPELKSTKSIGYLRILCPKGSSKFILTNESGISNEYFCPWEGEVDSGTYKVNLLGQSSESASEVVVQAQESVQHIIPSKVSSACSVAIVKSHHYNWGVFGLLAISLSLIYLRRRKSEV